MTARATGFGQWDRGCPGPCHVELDFGHSRSGHVATFVRQYLVIPANSANHNSELIDG